jgi:hypothetical protein
MVGVEELLLCLCGYDLLVRLNFYFFCCPIWILVPFVRLFSDYSIKGVVDLPVIIGYAIPRFRLQRRCWRSEVPIYMSVNYLGYFNVYSHTPRLDSICFHRGPFGQRSTEIENGFGVHFLKVVISTWWDRDLYDQDTTMLNDHSPFSFNNHIVPSLRCGCRCFGPVSMVPATSLSVHATLPSPGYRICKG